MALARWKDLCIDAVDAHGLADFWGPVLGRAVEHQDNGDAVLRGERPEETIWVNAVPEAKRVKHRVHLDLRLDGGDVGAERQRLLDLGATELWSGQQGPHTWVTMADPEGNELCI